jgi:hypothetical protein
MSDSHTCGTPGVAPRSGLRRKGRPPSATGAPEPPRIRAGAHQARTSPLHPDCSADAKELRTDIPVMSSGFTEADAARRFEGKGLAGWRASSRSLTRRRTWRKRSGCPGKSACGFRPRLSSPLKGELGSNLNQPWAGRADDLPEVGAADVAVHRRRAIELGVVEDVECLKPQFHRMGFR